MRVSYLDFFILGKNYEYKGLGNAHPALCGTFLKHLILPAILN
jgi:hypothetical protein